MSVSRVELVFELDRALCAGAPPRLVVDVVVASAVTRASELLALLRTRMERETLAAPVRVVVLRAVALVPAEQRTLDLLAPEPKAARALPRLVSELAAEIDPANVGTLQLVDTWIPDERTRLVPFGAEHAASGRSPLVTTALEPSRLARPCTVPRSALRHVRWLVRVEGVEWWRRGFVRRDIVAAWLRDGDSAAATVWAELGSNRVASPRPRNGEAGRAAEAPALRSEPEEHATIRGWID